MSSEESVNERSVGCFLLPEEELGRIASEIYKELIGIAPHKNCERIKLLEKKLDDLQCGVLKRLYGQMENKDLKRIKAEVELDLMCSSEGAL